MARGPGTAHPVSIMGTPRRDSEFTAAPSSARDSGQGRQPGGETSTAQGETQHPVPRQPHERDESSDQQAAEEPSMKRLGRLAHADVQRGVADTTRGAELDATYHRLRQGPGEDAGEPQGEKLSPPARPASRR